MKPIAVIPARGGSKRIPGKNIRMFHGEPMIAWSIDNALKSKLFSRIIVSTDDENIAHIAINAGAEIPFFRPEKLANDHTPTIPVIRHAIKTLKIPDYCPVCCIYATAPFTRPEDLVIGLEKLNQIIDGFAFSVTTFAFPIQRALELNEKNETRMINPESFLKRSQDLKQAWHDAGQFYWGRALTWNTADIVFSPKSVGVEIPRYRVQDIDTEEDWIRAERLFSIEIESRSTM